MFYINYEECKYSHINKSFFLKFEFYINYEECKFEKHVMPKKIPPSFILTMRNVNGYVSYPQPLFLNRFILTMRNVN